MSTIEYERRRESFLHQHRRTFLRTALAIVLVAVTCISVRAPWIWFGSKRAYVIRRFGSEAAYRTHQQLTFDEDEDVVAYDDNPESACKLVTERWSDQAEDMKRYEECALFLYWPRRVELPRCIDGGRWMNSLVFLHERVGPSGNRRLVTVIGELHRSPTGRSIPGNLPFRIAWRVAAPGALNPGDSVTEWKDFHSFDVPAPEGYWRLYFGQVDPQNDAHLTIRYEFNHIGGMIDGWLQTDDTIKFHVRDGPAVKP